MMTKIKKTKTIYKLTSIEVELFLFEKVKAKLLDERKSFRQLVEEAMKKYLTEEQ